MDTIFWRRQTGKPLFPELEWNKPERRNQAGRLLIIGGNAHALNAPAKSYEIVKKEGIGEVKIALPDSTKKLVGVSLPDAVFLPSTHSGEFAQEAEIHLLSYAQWADSLLLIGDTGRNSQTAILFDQLLKNYSGQVLLTRDALDLLLGNPKNFVDRPHTTLIITFAELQKLVKNSGETVAITASMDLVQLVEFLHNFSYKHPMHIVTYWQGQLIAAVGGTVSTTKITTDSKSHEPPFWRTTLASLSACYLTWNPNKPLEALTHSAYILSKTL